MMAERGTRAGSYSLWKHQCGSTMRAPWPDSSGALTAAGVGAVAAVSVTPWLRGAKWGRG